MAKDVQALISVRPDFQVKRGTVKAESGLTVTKIARAIYDTALNDSSGVSNKTVAAHGTGVFLPKGAILIAGWTDVITTFTSATSAATIALKAEAANDLVAAVAINSGTSRWNAGLGGLLVGNYAERTVAGDTAILSAASMAASFIKTTAEREIVATVGVEALTAGKMVIFVEYITSA